MASLVTSSHAPGPSRPALCTETQKRRVVRRRELATRHGALPSGCRRRGGREEPDWSPGPCVGPLPAVSSCGLSQQQTPARRGNWHLTGTQMSTSMPVAHNDASPCLWLAMTRKHLRGGHPGLGILLQKGDFFFHSNSAKKTSNCALQVWAVCPPLGVTSGRPEGKHPCSSRRRAPVGP